MKIETKALENTLISEKLICQNFSTFFLILSLAKTSFMKTCQEIDNWLSNEHLNNTSEAVKPRQILSRHAVHRKFFKEKTVNQMFTQKTLR